MPRLNPTPQLIADIVARIPEGFIRKSTLEKRVRMPGSKQNPPLQFDDIPVARADNIFYDTARLTLEQVQAARDWCRPMLPQMTKQGDLLEAPIMQRLAERDVLLEADPEAAEVVQRLAELKGHAEPHQLIRGEGTRELALQRLLDAGALVQHRGMIFDPLHLGPATRDEVARLRQIAPIRDAIIGHLQTLPGGVAQLEDLNRLFGEDVVPEALGLGGLVRFSVPVKIRPYKSVWIRLEETPADVAQRLAADAVRIADEAWEESVALSGSGVRPDARDGNTRRMRVLARTYTPKTAARRLGVGLRAFEQALADSILPSFVDPEEQVRIPAEEVEAAVGDIEYLERITAYERLTAREIALVSGVNYATARRRLMRAQISRTEPTWGEVRGRWKLPDTFADFRTLYRERLEEQREARLAEQIAVREQARLQKEAEARERETLRARLVAAFPTWQHAGRADQRILLHVGPPNSGKTHDALDALVAAGSGWYLAPLRLLAFEVFDRLNQRGVPCSLLTGEEYIPVADAQFVAATIEMLNPMESGSCVVIDEAQMFADADRGWAWTRALMENEAPEIHVIGPPTVQGLTERLARTAAIPLQVIEHQRLTPIRVADKPFKLESLPPSTILVAFSRAMVLQLMTELEGMGRRVSVVYGNLPPEVRRKQADRFAVGETEICIATDAVGMGLNLPADYVCFYEVEKYDGRDVRPLLSSEIHQIGGRAGRFGLSQIGEISAMNQRDLDYVREMFDARPRTLTHAYVAPSVADLEMIPGSLADKLVQWSLMESIPDDLRGALKTADLTERIELSRMLSDREIDQLGLEAAVKLTNAPTRQSSRAYWRSCAYAILAGRYMPPPPEPPERIATAEALESTERSIACADIYLWLSRRPEFGEAAPAAGQVRAMRHAWSMRIDDALLHRLDMTRRCTQCGRALPLRHRFNICNRCYNQRYNYF